jgi:hypothetical protein
MNLPLPKTAYNERHGLILVKAALAARTATSAVGLRFWQPLHWTRLEWHFHGRSDGRSSGDRDFRAALPPGAPIAQTLQRAGNVPELQATLNAGQPVYAKLLDCPSMPSIQTNVFACHQAIFIISHGTNTICTVAYIDKAARSILCPWRR